MGWWHCCCEVSCELGSDDFNRANANPPSGSWHVVSGEWEILDNEVNCITAGILATTICHPVAFEYGSWIVNMKLVGLRTWAYHEVGAGNPASPVYRIQWVPSGMDTADAKITIRIYDGTSWHEFDQIWTSSADELNVQVCYQPGAMIRASAGPEPRLDVCIPLEPSEPCWSDGGTAIGNFWFAQGTFDDWTYFATIIDDKTCDPCGCFCYIYDSGRSLEEWLCYPETLYLHLERITGECSSLDGITIPLTQGNAAPGDGWPEKKSWFSPVQSCSIPTSADYTFIADCTPILSEDGRWFIGLSLRIGGTDYSPDTTVFLWDDVGSSEYVSNTTRLADPSLSRCTPLDLVYSNLKIQSVFGPCGAPGEFGYFPFCCPLPSGVTCYPTAPEIVFTARITT